MRNSAPDAAFAFITTIDGEKHRLLKHHNNKVNDGNDNETVDVELLKCALNIVDQLPASEEEKNEIRRHLKSHSAVVTTGPQPNDIKDRQQDVGLREDLENDPRTAREVVSAQQGGPSGNQNITDPRIDDKLIDEPAITRKAEEQLRQESAGSSIVGGGSTPITPGKDNSPANTNPDDNDRDGAPPTDVETVSPGGKGASVPAVTGDAATSSPGQDVVHEDSIGNPSKSSVEKSTSGPKAPVTAPKGKQPSTAGTGQKKK